MGETWLRGRYEILDTLGGRPPATTNLALDHQTGGHCVVRIISMAQPEALGAHERLIREAGVLRRLDHPGIPRLLDSWSEDTPEPRAVLVREHVEGATLAALVDGGRRFGERDALRIGAKLAGILAYLHGLSPAVLHRDLQPASIVLGPHERVSLVDFGSARDGLAPPVLHPTGSVRIGTRGYGAPELQEDRAVPASDLYSLGATLVFLLSGSAPTPDSVGGDAARIAARLAVSRSTARLLQRLLGSDWHERPASATELAGGAREARGRPAGTAASSPGGAADSGRTRPGSSRAGLGGSRDRRRARSHDVAAHEGA